VKDLVGLGLFLAVTWTRRDACDDVIGVEVGGCGVMGARL
jgi:hypothetical protein